MSCRLARAVLKRAICTLSFIEKNFVNRRPSDSTRCKTARRQRTTKNAGSRFYIATQYQNFCKRLHCVVLRAIIWPYYFLPSHSVAIISDYEQ